MQMEFIGEKVVLICRLVVMVVALLFLADVGAVISRAEEPSTAIPQAGALGTPTSLGDSRLIDNDGKTLWQSPTDGLPLNLAYLPPGCQIILALRPEAIAAHPQGAKILVVADEIVQRQVKTLDGLLPHVAEIKQCLIGGLIGGDGHWQLAIVAHLSGGPTAAAYFASAFTNATRKSYDDKEYWLVNNRAYYLPTSDDERLIVVASEEAIHEIIDLAGSPPPLRRDMERLLAYTDSSRHATLLFAPNILFGEGENLFSGEASRLKDPLVWLFGDNLSSAAISIHLDDDFFIEYMAIPTLDVPLNKAANQLSDRLAKSPDRLASYVATLSTSEYSRAVVARFPDMVRTVAAYTRHRADRDHVVLRCYLPAIAGQNLLLGAELTLAEGNMGASAAADSSAGVASPKSARERLQKRTSLRFTKDTLEAALKMLADDVGVEIVIRGPDLQLDGITKNQSFGIDLSDKPAEEILVQILRLANPDKTATGPADPKQKLVYVVQPKPGGGSEAIFVTTRAAAQKRGDRLPAVFTAK
jgi:hypothetical protein